MANPFSGIGDIAKLMKQAKSMQGKMKEAQDEIAQAQVVGEAGAGVVKLTITGDGEALNLFVDPTLYQEDKKVLQGLILAAINDANTKRDLKKKDIMTKFMSDMGLPENFELPGDM